MNTRKMATESIVEFIKSDEKCALLTGTYQNEKHPLVLSTINELFKGSRILFRANSMQNLSTFFRANKNFKTGVAYNLGSNTMYVDTINPRTWRNSPNNFNFAVVYPFDSVTKDGNKQSIMDDLFKHRNIEKVFLVSWTDNIDFSWSNDYVDRKIAFDAEEENPEYHQRMIDLLTKNKYW